MPVSLSVMCLLSTSRASAQQSASVKASSLESHEGVTITALPWTDPAQYKEKFPKKSPLSAGVLAIQVVFRNDSDDSVKINLERIRLNVILSEDNPQGIEPLSSGQAADVIVNGAARDPSVTRKRFPIPNGKPRTGHDKQWTEVEKALRDAGVQAGVVAPHGSVKGLLYFDLQGQFDLLNTAHLYVPEVVAIDKNRALLYFEIDLSRPSSR